MAMAAEYDIHPHCENYPYMSESELQDMADDIKINGLIQPITKWRNWILDGKDRLKACKIAHVMPCFQDWYPSHPDDEDKTDSEIKAFCRSMNEIRRHIPKSVLSMKAAEASLSQPKHDRSHHKTIKEIATELDVSPASVSRAKDVLTKGADSLVEAVKDGSVSVWDASKIIDESEEVQSAAVEAVRAGDVETVSKAVKKSAKDSFDVGSFATGTVEEEYDMGVKDQYGKPVPVKFSPVFTKRNEIKKGLNQIAQVLTMIESLSEGNDISLTAMRIDIGETRRLVEQAKMNLRACIPTSICGHCKGDGHKCKSCKGSGWWAKVEHDHLVTDEHKKWFQCR